MSSPLISKVAPLNENLSKEACICVCAELGTFSSDCACCSATRDLTLHTNLIQIVHQLLLTTLAESGYRH